MTSITHQLCILFAKLLCVLVQLNWISDCRSDDAAPLAKHSASELRKMMGSMLERISSIELTYVGVSSPPAKDGEYIRRKLAIKRPFWLYHHGSHGSSTMPWNDDPDQQVAWIQQGRFINSFPWRRTYTIHSWSEKARLPGSLQGEQWFKLSGIWILASREPPLCFGLAPVLDVVAESDDYSVRPEMENVAGTWCHVLERKDVDVLWVDGERQACLLKRQIFDPTGKLFVEIVLSDYVESFEAIFMPTKMYFESFSWEESKREKKVAATFHIEEIKVNAADDRVFHWEPSPGAIIISRKSHSSGNDEKTIEPGGQVFLEDVVGWAGRMYGPPQAPETQPMWIIVCGIGLFSVCLFSLLILWRSRNVDNKELS
jgi:hypothetical protein